MIGWTLFWTPDLPVVLTPPQFPILCLYLLHLESPLTHCHSSQNSTLSQSLEFSSLPLSFAFPSELSHGPLQLQTFVIIQFDLVVSFSMVWFPFTAYQGFTLNKRQRSALLQKYLVNFMNLRSTLLLLLRFSVPIFLDLKYIPQFILLWSQSLQS